MVLINDTYLNLKKESTTANEIKVPKKVEPLSPQKKSTRP
jgi:hypothetical protein